MCPIVRMSVGAIHTNREARAVNVQQGTRATDARQRSMSACQVRVRTVAVASIWSTLINVTVQLVTQAPIATVRTILLVTHLENLTIN